MVLELRPAHDPRKAWGFVGVVISVADLCASVWLWHRDDDRWATTKVITIPAEPTHASELPPALQPFGAVPPLVTDIDLSVDDRWLYVSWWGTGELKQYDVSDPHNPTEAGSVRLGGIVRHTAHPAAPDLRLSGGPQMVEVSRDGGRVSVTNSLYATWDDIFYPDGVGAWVVRIDADTEAGAMTVDQRFLPHDDDFRGLRVHQPASRAGCLERLLVLRRIAEQGLSLFGCERVRDRAVHARCGRHPSVRDADWITPAHAWRSGSALARACDTCPSSLADVRAAATGTPAPIGRSNSTGRAGYAARWHGARP
jgi:56kDa selenium binding protein (SBP56)